MAKKRPKSINYDVECDGRHSFFLNSTENGDKEKCMVRRILFALSLLLAAAIAHAGEAAHVVFVAGDARIGGENIAFAQAVQEGSEIATGADGYVYLKTVDNGFLILRPNSRARIASYHVDRQNPANTRVKLELLSGVARSISGEGVKQARQNFRFNTPVAAIGVRGTDFTVYTDQETSRVAVVSGGVVVSGFSATCSRDGGGPCEGKATRELFANQVGQLLQVRKDQLIPQLLPNNNSLSPDSSAPPRNDEPSSKTSSNTINAAQSLLASDISLDPQKNADLLARFRALTAQQTLPTPVTSVEQPQRQIIWGRWQALLDQPANIDIVKLINNNAQLLALNSYFAVLRTPGADWQIPASGTAGFALKQSEAYILNEPTRTFASAKLENAQLQIDFGKASFATSFDLVSQQSERYKFNAIGDVTRDGQLLGANQLILPTNMSVSGAVGPANGGTAAYIFQGRIDNQRQATGITSWAKQ
jgi:hypothetical protein